MKKYLTWVILLSLSFLFYWISYRSYDLHSGPLESLELFRLFRGVSTVIAFFVPLVIFIFYLLTSSLMFNLLDEKFDVPTMARAISISLLPVILNCLVYLSVLYSVDKGDSLQEMLHHRSVIGLSLADMEQVSYVFWLGFYLFFVVLIRHEFGLSYCKAVAIAVVPTVLVVTAKYLFQVF